MIRRVLSLALALLLPATAAAAVPPALGPDGRVYPLAGGGTEALRDGLAATQARLPGGFRNLAALPDGAVVWMPEEGAPFVVGPDGGIRMLPTPAAGADTVVAAADGALLAVRTDPIGVQRLAPGAAAWVEEAVPSAVPRGLFLRDVVALPAGYALIGDRRTWRVEGGTATPVAHDPFPGGATAAADGTIYLSYQGGGRLVSLPPGGPPVELAAADGPADLLVALPGGGLLGATTFEPAVVVIAPDGTLETRLDREPGLGLGLGGPFSGAPDGLPFGASEDGAILLAGERRLFAAVPPGSGRLLAALAPASYRGLAAGTVTVASTMAGTAAVAVRDDDGEVVAAATAAVAAGETVVALPGAPLPGRYRVTLTVTAPDGRETADRLRVLTLERLTRAAALRERRRFQRESSVGELDGGQYVDLRHCRRDGARAYSCQAVQVSWQRKPRRDIRRCIGIWVAQLRPDGIHSRVRVGPRACKARGPVR